VHAAREDQILAPLGDVRLQHADAAERFVEPSGDARELPAPLAVDRAKPPEREGDAETDRREEQQHDARDAPVDPEQDTECRRRRDERTEQLHEAGAEQVPDPVRVAHDARAEHAGLRRVERLDGEAEHVRRELAAHVGHGALRGGAEDERQRVAGCRLHDRRDDDDPGERQEQTGALLDEHVVDEVLRRRGQHEPGEPAHEREHDADGDVGTMPAQQQPQLAPRARRASLRVDRRLEHLLRLRETVAAGEHAHWGGHAAEGVASAIHGALRCVTQRISVARPMPTAAITTRMA